MFPVLCLADASWVTAAPWQETLQDRGGRQVQVFSLSLAFPDSLCCRKTV
jgi:hypothetical protein